MILKLAVAFFLLFSASDGEYMYDRSECLDTTTASVLIVKGEPSPRYKWPWLVSLVLRETKNHFCGGTLISDRYVLTAAHCLKTKMESSPVRRDEFDVYLGKWNVSDHNEVDAKKAEVEEFFIHEDWLRGKTWDADIALIKVAYAVVFSSKIRPVCVWTPDLMPAMNDGGVAVGW